MTSCNYHVLQSIYETTDQNLAAIAEKIDALDLDIKIDELDVDLDNLEAQLKIANKLKLLESIGIDIMTEEEQTAAYTAIKNELFAADSAETTTEP